MTSGRGPYARWFENRQRRWLQYNAVRLRTHLKNAARERCRSIERALGLFAAQ